MSMPTCPSCVYAQCICEKTGVKIRYSTGCTYHKPKRITNADRIRAMIDEELADKFEEIQLKTVKAYGNDDLLLKGELKKYWLDWLKQEAKNAES